MNIIGISGKAGSGKDTVASYLSDRYANTYVEHFADPLKRACAAAFGIPVENFSSPALKEKINAVWGVSPRKIAQFVGTEMFRDLTYKLIYDIGSDFWMRRMNYLVDGDIDTENGATYEDKDTIVIADVRFQNEYDWIVDRGGIVIRLLRDEITDANIGIPGHSSEAGFNLRADIHKVYTIFNNDSKEKLYEDVEECLSLSGIDLYRNVLLHRTVSTQFD